MMNTQKQEPAIVIKPRRALYIFGGAGIVLVILSFMSQYIRLSPNSFGINTPLQMGLARDFISEFDFNGQPDIVIYYNVLTLNVAAFLVFVIAYFKNMVKDKHRFHWAAMAWVVLFFAIDNLAVFHNKIKIYFQSDDGASGSSLYMWTIASGVGIAILALFFLRFWLHLDNKYRFLFLTSAVLYFAGVWGRELTTSSTSMDLMYSLFLTLEQGMQYGGAVLLIYSLLQYMMSFLPQFSVSTKDLSDKRGAA